MGEVLFRGLTNHTLKKVKRTGLPYFHFTEKEQVGKNFIERFLNAMRAVYNKGFTNVIVIGNDTPFLNTKHLRKAKLQSEKGNMVIGPSIDGGLYLMALNKKLFTNLPLKDLAWRTPKLMGGLALLAALNSVELIKLQVLADVDTMDDIRKAIDSYKLNSELLRLFLAVYGIQIKEEVFIGHNYNIKPFRYYRNKGSPCFFLS